MLEFSSGFSVKSVFWLSALRETEKEYCGRIVDDLRIVLDSSGVPFQAYDAVSPWHFECALKTIAESAKKDGMRPILHLDMHGSKEDGLEIGATGECVPWPKVVSLLQEINVATGNNLCVVAAACFGFHAIEEVKITEPSPFFILIAPENEVFLGFLAQKTGDFYRDVFSKGDLWAAFDEHLSPQMRDYHADKMLFMSVAKYIRNHCKGKGSTQRRERLLTEVFLAGLPQTDENLKSARQKIKEGIRPDSGLMDKYVQDFLVGKKPGFTFDDLLSAVEKSIG